MLAELRIGSNNRNGFNLPHKDWINRYTNTHVWTEHAWNLLLTPGSRTKIVEIASPIDQYRAMELFSRFINDDPTKIKDGFDKKTEQLVGNIFGDILFHHLISQDTKRKKSFVSNQFLLTISSKSLTIALEKFFKSFNGTPIAIDEDMKVYLVKLLLNLGITVGIDHLDGLSNLIPSEIADELNSLLELREQKRLSARLNLSTT